MALPIPKPSRMRPAMSIPKSTAPAFRPAPVRKQMEAKSMVAWWWRVGGRVGGRDVRVVWVVAGASPSHTHTESTPCGRSAW